MNVGEKVVLSSPETLRALEQARHLPGVGTEALLQMVNASGLTDQTLRRDLAQQLGSQAGVQASQALRVLAAPLASQSESLLQTARAAGAADQALASEIAKLQGLGVTVGLDLTLFDGLTGLQESWKGWVERVIGPSQAVAALATSMSSLQQSLDLSGLMRQVVGETSPQAFLERFPVALQRPAARLLVQERRSVRALEELPQEDLAAEPSPAASTFAQVTLVGTMAAGTDAVPSGARVRSKREELLSTVEDALARCLQGRPELLRKLMGARAALRDKNNPDRVAQYCISMRGLFERLVAQLAPASAVAHLAENKRSLRYNQLLYLAEISGTSRALRRCIVAKVEFGVKVLDVVNGAVHGGCDLSADDLDALRLDAEQLIWQLVAHPRFQ